MCMVIKVSLIKHIQQRNYSCRMNQETKQVSENTMAESVTSKQISPGNIILVESFTLVNSFPGHQVADLILLIPKGKNLEASNLK